MRFILRLIFLCFSLNCSAQVKILFDASQAEMAGNADWVIDANSYNIGFNGTGAATTGIGNEANPAITPSPAQSGITSSTVETYWSGALSSWAIDLVKLGYQVETLPYNGVISYGNISNTQDLSNYKVLIVCEPNIRFTSAEKTALINFVQNGGGLFMIADHDQSDRNGDGWDSPSIWNDLMNTNSVQSNLFGMNFDLVDISETSYNYSPTANDTITNGITGTAYGVKLSNGSMITINTTANSSAAGIIYEASAIQDADSILVACANFGNGRVAALSDSSPCDDGTGDVNDNLFYGYSDLSGYHSRLLLNTTVWLAGNYTSFSNSIRNEVKQNEPVLYPNPGSKIISLQSKTGKILELSISDLSGRIVKKADRINADELSVDISSLPPGSYFITLVMKEGTVCRNLVVTE
ncbi:MAG: T9SS type A sorting domain-containing protein [Bacteroidia bacterium]